MNEIRKDFLVERYAIISEKRGARPRDYKKIPQAPAKKGQVCFFCPGNEALTPPTIAQFPAHGEWQIRVFQNKFPALSPPKGEHEIVVDTNKHSKELHDLKPEEIVDVFKMYEKRRIELEKKFAYVSIFKNVGKEGGASLAHAHTQILATPIIPPIPSREKEAAKIYYDKWHRCPWCDEVENIPENRVASKTRYTRVITPNAPRFSYESWVMPKNHASNFSDLDSKEALDFCKELKKVLTKTYNLTGSYNFVLHNARKGITSYHFHIEILPRVARHAGYELGEGAYIVEVSPESAARFFRS